MKMKVQKFKMAILLVFFSLLMVKSFGQIIYVQYDDDGKVKRYPALKMEGEKWYYNHNEASNPEWGKLTNPFYISESGDLTDADYVKIGWYVGNSFYLMNGWVVLDGEKQYYKSKEIIYNENEIAARFCNDARFFIVPTSNHKIYKLQFNNRQNGGRETIFEFQLGNLAFNKKTAVAMFSYIKLISEGSIKPCGYGEDDWRPELISKYEEEKRKQERAAMLEQERIAEEMRQKEYQRRQDSINLAKQQKIEKEENDYRQMIDGMKSKPFTEIEQNFAGSWEFKSEKIFTNDAIYIFREEYKVNLDRTYTYKSYLTKWLETPIYREYNEKGIWEIKDNTFYAYINEEDGKPSKRIDPLVFDKISAKKASRTAKLFDDLPPLLLKGKKVAGPMSFNNIFDANSANELRNGNNQFRPVK